MKVVICTPTYSAPHPKYVQALKDSVPALDALGVEHSAVFEVGCPYISAARSTMLTKALKANADVIVFIDDDLSWKPEDLVRLITTEGEVVCGTYRYKTDEHVTYMGAFDTDENGIPKCRADRCISASRVPAGFLKVTRSAVETIRQAFPELCLNDGIGVDLFNHGAIDGVWHGEDYAFSKRWVEVIGRPIWLIPDLDLDHHTREGNSYPGNFNTYLRKQPGGDLWKSS